MSKGSKSRRRDLVKVANQRLHSSNNSNNKLNNFTAFPGGGFVNYHTGEFIKDLRQIEDRRRWHPEGKYRPAASLNRSRHRLTTAVTSLNRRVSRNQPLRSRYVASAFRDVPIRVGFREPESVLVCIRRNIRREVLHALGFHGRGRGRGGLKIPVFRWYSKISCKKRRR